MILISLRDLRITAVSPPSHIDMNRFTLELMVSLQHLIQTLRGCLVWCFQTQMSQTRDGNRFSDDQIKVANQMTSICIKEEVNLNGVRPRSRTKALIGIQPKIFLEPEA